MSLDHLAKAPEFRKFSPNLLTLALNFSQAAEGHMALLDPNSNLHSSVRFDLMSKDLSLNEIHQRLKLISKTGRDFFAVMGFLPEHMFTGELDVVQREIELMQIVLGQSGVLISLVHKPGGAELKHNFLAPMRRPKHYKSDITSFLRTAYEGVLLGSNELLSHSNPYSVDPHCEISGLGLVIFSPEFIPNSSIFSDSPVYREG